MQQAYGLVQQQVQRLAMTQTLQQAIAVLQMSTSELWEYVEEAVTENPMLDWVQRERQERARFRGVGRIGDVAALAVAQPDTLALALHEQLRLSDLCGSRRRLVHYLIDCLDERGYLEIPVEEIAEHLQIHRTDVLAALRELQGFEPPGIGARDLRECLHLQLTARSGDVNEGDDAVLGVAIRMVTGEWEALCGRRRSQLMGRLGCSKEIMHEALTLIQSLDPHPGLRYGASGTIYVVPDMAILRTSDGYVVAANDVAFPHLRVNEEYRSYLSVARTERGAEADTRDYLLRNLSSATALLRSIDARRRTLLRVTEALVIHQQGFFDFGSTHMRPLTLRMIADELGLHESTVSRAVAGKFVQTPQGVFEFRYFFPSRLGSDDGVGVSAASVKASIKALIEGESQEVLTDQALAVMLQDRGIQISRRTVAKYREEMKIAPSPQRRELAH
ncbi:MAG: RNA polymerase factor sigma-54 [Bacilli bacterium]